MVICQGCGQLIEVPVGYGRNKIQCPGCGVICTVPAGTESSPHHVRAAEPVPPGRAPSASLEDEAANWLRDAEPVPIADEPPPRFEEPPPRLREEAPPVRAPKSRSPERLFPCRRCGRLIRKQRECPSCDGFPEEPLADAIQEKGPLGFATHSLELDEPASPQAPRNPYEDDSPYALAEKLLPRCPKCSKEMAEDAVVCVSCGYNLRTRKKAGRSYEPVARSWESDMALSPRLALLGLGQGIHFTMAILSTVLGGPDFWAFLITWPLMTAVLCFVLGTYDKIDLTRDTRGRVRVTIRWRFCFYPMEPKETEVRGFEGVTTGQWHDAGFWEWFVVLSLLPLGVVPSIIWWYVTIYKPYYHVALAQDHGYAAVYVYRGRSPQQMLDISTSLCEASGLKLV